MATPPVCKAIFDWIMQKATISYYLHWKTITIIPKFRLSVAAIEELFNRQEANNEKWNDKSEESMKIDKLIIGWFVFDYLSFKFFEGKGFIKLINTVFPKYRIEGRNYYANKMVNQQYEKINDIFRSKFQKTAIFRWRLIRSRIDCECVARPFNYTIHRRQLSIEIIRSRCSISWCKPDRHISW